MYQPHLHLPILRLLDCLDTFAEWCPSYSKNMKCIIEIYLLAFQDSALSKQKFTLPIISDKIAPWQTSTQSIERSKKVMNLSIKLNGTLSIQVTCISTSHQTTAWRFWEITAWIDSKTTEVARTRRKEHQDFWNHFTEERMRIEKRDTYNEM